MQPVILQSVARAMNTLSLDAPVFFSGNGTCPGSVWLSGTYLLVTIVGSNDWNVGNLSIASRQISVTLIGYVLEVTDFAPKLLPMQLPISQSMLPISADPLSGRACKNTHASI